jgi:hypothetical protein
MCAQSSTTDHYGWLRAPDAAVQLPDVPSEMLVDADFEAGAWMLDARLAREGAAAR